MSKLAEEKASLLEAKDKENAATQARQAEELKTLQERVKGLEVVRDDGCDRCSCSSLSLLIVCC